MKIIEETNDFYCDESGNIYKKENNEYLIQNLFINKRGYYYARLIDKQGKHFVRRVNRIIAITYIENPNNYPIVGHKNNIKTDNRVENLYWTTYKENTQKAIEDKLIVKQPSSWDDNQSIPVCVLNKDKEIIDVCGSIREAHRKYKVSQSTIKRHCCGEVKTSRTGLYFCYYNANK